MRRIIMGIVTLPFVMGTAVMIAPAANADPFTCPGTQTSQKIDGQWTCVNSQGNTNNSEDPRNPNEHKL